MKRALAPASNEIRVIVADDHPVVREGLAALIKSRPDMKLLCEAENGQAAVRQYFRYRPDVILVDLRMPEMDGVAAARAILQKDPRAKVIMLSTYRGDEDIYQTFKAGAKAYLLKDCRREELVNTIRSVHRGVVNLPSVVSAQLAAGILREHLTKREVEIIKLVAAGKSNKEIGAVLGVTEGTVKVHAGHIFKKLGASGRTEAIRIALERGVTHLPSL
jgi:two-component system NarL family response regulator